MKGRNLYFFCIGADPIIFNSQIRDNQVVLLSLSRIRELKNYIQPKNL
jgi:hypothetical protein